MGSFLCVVYVWIRGLESRNVVCVFLSQSTWMLTYSIPGETITTSWPLVVSVSPLPVERQMKERVMATSDTA